MGPHGMLIGTTGSGKSEFLRNLVINLMVTHSPEMLNLLLADYKGGSTFLGLVDAPHVTAVVTNMEEEAHLVARFKEAINGEIGRREKIIRAANERFPRKDIKDLRDYNRVRSSGADLDPLPSLLVIVDEFTELLKDHPEYGSVFKTIGRLGRSWGIHLLYAAQTLEEQGRTHGLEANVAYKIGLKTLTASDSRQLLDGSDAAFRLPGIPGHGVLKAAILDDLQQFRSCYTGSPYFPLSAANTADQPQRAHTNAHNRDEWAEPLPFTASVQPLPAVDDTPTTIEPEYTEAEIEDAPTIFTTLVDRIRNSGAPQPYRMYQPPLVAATLDDVCPQLSQLQDFSVDDGLSIPMGFFDDPARHVQPPWTLSVSGNVLITGGKGRGKSTTVETIIAALAACYPQQQVQLFIADFTGGIDSTLSELPHVSGWGTAAQEDTINKMLSEMSVIRRNRETLFRHHGIHDMNHYRKLRSSANPPFDTADPYGEVVLVIEGWDAAVAETGVLYNRGDDVIQSLVGGSKFGLHLVVSTAQHKQLRSVSSHTGTSIELHSDETSMVDTQMAKERPSEPGNVIVSESSLYGLVSLPRIDGIADPETIHDGIADLVQRVCAHRSGQRAEKLKTLPTSLLREELFAMAPPVDPGDDVRRRLRVPFAVRESNGKPAYAEMHKEPHLLVLGEGKTGKSELLATFMHSISRCFPTRNDAAVLLYDPRSAHMERIPETNLYATVKKNEQFVEQLKSMIAEFDLVNRDVPEDAGVDERRQRRWWSGPEVFIIIDDYDFVTPRHATEPPPVHELIGWVSVDGYERGIHIVVASDSGNIATKTQTDPILKRMLTDRTPAVLLSTSKLEGTWGATKFTQHSIPGRARYVEAGVRRDERIHAAWSGQIPDDIGD